MRLTCRAALLLPVALICLGGSATVSAKDVAISSTAVAELSDVAQKLTAFGGYVVFSQLDTQGRWALMDWHDGKIARLPMPARRIPFDAQVGPGIDGQPTVVFSKCKVDPPYDGGGTRRQQNIEWWRGLGCQIYDLVLPAGPARPIAGIRPRHGYSDTTPAIWDGNVAFARHSVGPRSTRLYVWRHASGVTNQIGGGPSACPAGGEVCPAGGRVIAAWVNSLTLDAQAASYEWIMRVPSQPFGIIPEPEIRFDPLIDGRQSGPSKVVSNALFRGTCGGVLVGSPSLAGANVLYDVNLLECEKGAQEITNRFAWYLEEHKERETRISGPGVAVALAWDHGIAYWIDDQLPPELNCEPVVDSCEELHRREEAGCAPGFAACGAIVFGHLRGCGPGEGKCTLMATTNLRDPQDRGR